MVGVPSRAPRQGVVASSLLLLLLFVTTSRPQPSPEDDAGRAPPGVLVKFVVEGGGVLECAETAAVDVEFETWHLDPAEVERNGMKMIP